MEEAQDAHAMGNYEEFKKSLRNTDRVVAELADALDFTYPLAGELYALYTFLRKSLMSCMVKNDTQGIVDAKRVLTPLYTAFVKVAEQDTSEPLMRNTQQVYAGITYGKENLKESFHEPDTSRGFFV
jgi:flagellar protein FliS